MGFSVGIDKNEAGKFSYEIWMGFETVETVGGFTTKVEAERAAEIAHRNHLIPVLQQPSAPHMTLDEIMMSDDELLSELGL